MPDITIQRQGELVRGVFEILLTAPDGIRAQDVLATLRGRLTLTEHEKGRYKSGAPVFDKVVRFATIPYVKAGWLTKRCTCEEH